MLTPKTQYNLANAKDYFTEHLSVGDYYTEGESVAGHWFGNGVSLLGLAKVVKQDDFLSLCDNLHPATGELLTQRRKTVRRDIGSDGSEQEVANRRVFFDFTISPPKSVSIMAFVGEDDRILDAHNRAVGQAMRELERFAATRVRAGGQCEDRLTGNLVGAIFRHETSRALDPHLHSHCILFNATFDPVEDRWKALQNYEMLRARKYVENVYYHELARELRRFGYEIENHARGDFQIRGIPEELCDRFSKRHAEIDEKTRALLAKSPEKTSGNIAEIRNNIAHSERSRKIKDVAMDELRALWHGQMSDKEREDLAALRTSGNGEPLTTIPESAQQAVEWAEEHLFERKSVLLEYEIWLTALERMRGENVDLAEIHEVTRNRDYIRNVEDQPGVTTYEVLQREYDIVAMAQTGIGAHETLCPDYRETNPSLDEGQRAAVAHMLSSTDFITLFRGGAGTGKSFTLSEVDRQLRQSGRTVHVVAPQRQQVLDLAKDGFELPKTLSEFLVSPEIKRGEVVIVDEAGQIGAKQMLALLELVKAHEGRVILSGDTRQHGAVEASDALRAIEKYSGLRAAELTEIRRQDPARAKTEAERERIVQYRKAVEEAAAGAVKESFETLDELGAVVQCDFDAQRTELISHYLEHSRKAQSSLIVSQSWSEIHQLNETIRETLKAENLIKGKEKVVVTLERIDLTSAQKRDSRYVKGDCLAVLNRDTCGLKRGETGIVLAVVPNGLIVETDKKVKRIPAKFFDHLTICREKEMLVAPGERLQLKANGKTRAGERLANGELVTVSTVHGNGEIRLEDGRILPADYRQFGYGYAVTSYASQGKTVDYVLFSDSTIAAATNTQQWYVSISRGRKGIRIFTNDKEQLATNVARLGDRTLALEIAPPETVSPPRRNVHLAPVSRALRLRQYLVHLRLRVAAMAKFRKHQRNPQELKP